MSSPSARGRRGRGRRAADQVRQEILQAAGDLLLESGMAGFTVEKVAALAGASRVTVHKWWPSKGALAFDGYFTVVASTLDDPDTGDVATDLTTQLRAFVHLMRDTRAGLVLRELIGHAQIDPELSTALRERYALPRAQRFIDTLERAKRKGQLRADVNSEDIVCQLWGACYFQLLVTGRPPLTDEFVTSIVRNMLVGIRTGPPTADDAGRRPAGVS
ncbi:TetR/AcrR family transcriptional regulator [Microbispora sp. RL4-1S]|uniref:TetR/AcrR family transcriptional regulator n=1 Tax=Microbispora oryzae TaxID=2806554 RepID=A0A940WTD9_9ACTN|nr:TetR/AcrR family transcriptional regulator [Microbispora oryzae]MBP2706674.1 TetR/AcrR family transcriptional regulator [Microbispora oryzae]